MGGVRDLFFFGCVFLKKAFGALKKGRMGKDWKGMNVQHNI